MMDISSVGTDDLRVFDTQVPKVKNILSVQLGDLDYALDLGIDLRYFLQNDLKFQNESFKSYILEVLGSRGINVSSLTDTIDSLFSNYIFQLEPEVNSSALVAG